MGIIVGLCLFLVAQLIIVFVVAHFWQRRRKHKEERVDSAKNMFNPYSSRRS